MKEVAAIEALKEAVESQGTVPLHVQDTVAHLKRSAEDEHKTSPDKRSKSDASSALKEASLNALADATAQSPNSSSGSLGVSSPFPFPYSYGGLAYAFPQGGVAMLEPEQYQQFLMQQQQMRYYEGMREMVRQQEEEGAAPVKKGRSKSANIPTASQTAAAYATGQYTGRFVLLEQPNVRQRKSYKNENRFFA